jgi:glycosyltransferase involved in cell wall biosynthesis
MLTTAAPFLTVFVPAFNEAEHLPNTLQQLFAMLPQQVPSFEVIVVNDGSSDDTGLIADAFAQRHPCVQVIHHKTNLGLGLGFVHAVQIARGEWFILIPADLAMKLEELPKYIHAAKHADIVVGHRNDRADYSAFRKLVSWANIGLIKLLFNMEQQQFNYISLYRTGVLQRLHLRYTNSALFFAEVLVRAKAQGCKLVNVWVDYVPRAHGQATGSNASLIVRTVRDIMAFWFRWTFIERHG